MSLYVWQYRVEGRWSIQTAMILADIDRALDEELDDQFFVFARINKN